MTVLSGFLTGSADGGAVNPAIAAALAAYSEDVWPAHATDALPGLSGMAGTAFPVASAAAGPVAGWSAGSFAGDWYERIHVVPRTIALGNLVSSQTRTVEVWNAYRGAHQTLTGVAAANAAGIDVNAPGTYPMDFAPLQSRSWSVNVTVSGSPTIDATLTWSFTGQAALAIAIAGARVTPWTVPPDWGKGVTETLLWLTDVQEAIDGSVQREPLREHPRRQWEFHTLAVGASGASWAGRELLETSLAAWRGRIWGVPVWADQCVLGAALAAGATGVSLDTTGLDIAVGGLVLLHAGPAQYEMMEVDSVTGSAITFTRATTVDFPAGTRLWPCHLARLTDTPQVTRRNANLDRVSVRFEATDDGTWSAVAPTATYRGYPVLEARPDVTQDPQASADRHLVTLDGDVGGVYVDDPSGLPWWGIGYTWRLDGRTQRADHRSLLMWLAGRTQALWVPSWADDVTLLADVPAGTQVLTVLFGGFARYAAGMPGRRHLRIERTDGSVEYRAITAQAEIDTTTEHLTIDSPLASALAPGQVRQISFMALAALAHDQVEIDHQNTSEGIARCAVVFEGLPKEEPAP